MKELCCYNNNEVKSVSLSSVTRSINTGLNPRNNFTLNETGADLYYLTVKEITSNRIIISKNTDKITWNAWNIIQKRSNVEKGDVLFSGIGTIGKVVYVEEENKNWNCSESLFIIKPIKELIDGKYLAYILTSNDIVNQNEANAGGSIMKGDRKATLQSIILPLPSISVQRQIVSQLDTFTTLIAKLESELTLRQKQYEFYREKLLNFDGDEEVEWKTMKEVFNIRNGYTPSKSNKAYWEGGTIPWFRVEDIRTNGRLLSESSLHINPEGVKGELFPANSIILSTSATIGEHALLLVDCLANQRFICLTINDKYKEKLLVKFVFYYMFKVDEWCVNNTNIAGFASVDMSKFYTLCFPIPKDQHRQQQIVSQLDTFEQLIAALKREIALRRKQYEFYREKLLTFE